MGIVVQLRRLQAGHKHNQRQASTAVQGYSSLQMSSLWECTNSHDQQGEEDNSNTNNKLAELECDCEDEDVMGQISSLGATRDPEHALLSRDALMGIKTPFAMC